MTAPSRCVLVGPGRTRNGLAPFLAGFLQEAGIRVVAGVGRDPQRTAAACAALAARLGHDVRPSTDLRAALAEVGPALCVIATPDASHLGALRAALAAGVPVLCEKPLVTADEVDAAWPVIDGFRDRGLLLAEGCQWPAVLPAFRGLFPATAGRVPARVAMRLSPSRTGRAMVEDSLSHLLSVLQELAPVDAATRVVEVRYAGASRWAVAVELAFGLETRAGAVDVRLELRRAAEQPRPAWLEVDGCRADRRIEPEVYSMRLEAPDRRSVPLDDPLRTLVYGVAADLREPIVERLRHHSERIRHRLRLYADLLAAWPRGAAGGADP